MSLDDICTGLRRNIPVANAIAPRTQEILNRVGGRGFPLNLFGSIDTAAAELSAAVNQIVPVWAAPLAFANQMGYSYKWEDLAQAWLGQAQLFVAANQHLGALPLDGAGWQSGAADSYLDYARVFTEVSAASGHYAVNGSQLIVEFGAAQTNTLLNIGLGIARAKLALDEVEAAMTSKADGFKWAATIGWAGRQIAHDAKRSAQHWANFETACDTLADALKAEGGKVAALMPGTGTPGWYPSIAMPGPTLSDGWRQGSR